MIVKIYFLFRFIFINQNITKINNLFLSIQYINICLRDAKCSMLAVNIFVHFIVYSRLNALQRFLIASLGRRVFVRRNFIRVSANYRLVNYVRSRSRFITHEGKKNQCAVNILTLKKINHFAPSYWRVTHWLKCIQKVARLKSYIEVLKLRVLCTLRNAISRIAYRSLEHNAPFNTCNLRADCVKFIIIS